MLQHCLPCRDSRGAATLPHRLPLRSIPPPRFACGSSHSRGHGRPRSVRKSSRLRGKCLFTELPLLRHSKSFGPSAPIAYATSVSPPDEAIAWPGRRYPIGNKALAWPGFRCWVLDDAVSSQGRRCWVANDAAGCPWHSSCKSPRALILVLGSSRAHWPARWPQFVLTEHGPKSYLSGYKGFTLSKSAR